MICWYCHWGWPKAVHDIFVAAKEKLGGKDGPLLFGPSHIVWEDENFSSAEWCLEHFEDYAQDLTAEEKAVVRWSLEELIKIPLPERDPCPRKYDEQDDADELDPNDYPPPAGMEMVK